MLRVYTTFLCFCLVAPAVARADEGHDRSLVIAAARGDSAAVSSELKAGANPNAAVTIGSFGSPMTPLLSAVFADSAAVAKLLVAAGADPRAQDSEAVRWAIFLQDDELAPALIVAMGRRRDDDLPLFAVLARRFPTEAARNLRLAITQSITTQTDEPNVAIALAVLSNFNSKPSWEGVSVIADAIMAAGFSPAQPIEEDGTPLEIALERGDSSLAAYLLAHGAQLPDGSPPDEVTTRLLVAAARGGDREGVRALLAQLADPKRPDSSGRLPLPEAAALDDKAIVTMLLASGARPDEHGPQQERALVHAARLNDVDMARDLLKAGAALDPTDSSPGWPLREAVRAGSWHVAELLLDGGAVVNRTDSRGRTVLHEMTGDLDSPWSPPRRLGPSHWSMPALLRKHGFDFTRQDVSRKDVLDSNVTGQGTDRELLAAMVAAGARIQAPAMRTAIIFKDAALLSWMLAHGADPNAPGVLTEAASQAAISEKPLIVLIRAGAKAPHDPDEQDSFIETLLTDGASRSLALLLDGGMQLRPTSMFEHFTTAVTYGRPEAIRLFVDRGANPSVVDSSGFTVLHRFVDRDARARSETAVLGRKQIAAAAALIDARLDFKIANRFGKTITNTAAANPRTQAWLTAAIAAAGGVQTPLHRAIRADDTSQVATLLKAGADMDAQDSLGRTPLTLALQLHRSAIAQHLLSKDAEYTITPRNAYQQADIDYAVADELATAFQLRMLRAQLLDLRANSAATKPATSLALFEANERFVTPDVQWSVGCDLCKPTQILSGDASGTPPQAPKRAHIRGFARSERRDDPSTRTSRYWILQDTLGPVSYEILKPLPNVRGSWAHELTFTVEGLLQIPACAYSADQNPTCYPAVTVENPNLPSSLKFLSATGPVSIPPAAVVVTQNGESKTIDPGGSATFDRSTGALSIRVGPITSKVFSASLAVTVGDGRRFVVSRDFEPGERTRLYVELAKLHAELRALDQAPRASSGEEAKAQIIRAKTLRSAIHVLSASAVAEKYPGHIRDNIRLRCADLLNLDRRVIELQQAITAQSYLTAEEIKLQIQRVEASLSSAAPAQRPGLERVLHALVRMRDAVTGTTNTINVLTIGFETDVARISRDYQALILEYAQYVDDATLASTLTQTDRDAIQHQLSSGDVIISDSMLDGRGKNLRRIFGLPEPTP